jgi:hypothetical protein
VAAEPQLATASYGRFWRPHRNDDVTAYKRESDGRARHLPLFDLEGVSTIARTASGRPPQIPSGPRATGPTSWRLGKMLLFALSGATTPNCQVCAYSQGFYRSEGRQIVDALQFFYRINADKTIDSICGFCYLTVATGESEAELHAEEAAHDCWKSYAPSMPAIRPAASSRSRADGSACSELDTEEAGGVRRPSSEAWMDATWKRNTQYISTKSPTLFTPLSRRASANFDGTTHQLLGFKDVQKARKDALKNGTLLTSPL